MSTVTGNQHGVATFRNGALEVLVRIDEVDLRLVSIVCSDPDILAIFQHQRAISFRRRPDSNIKLPTRSVAWCLTERDV